MALSPVASNSLAADAHSLDALKATANKDGPAAIKEAAKQLESLFMRELIKSMRQATMKSGMLDSPGGDLSADLLDQQLSVSMSGLPGGLSAAIERQLSQQTVGAEATKAAPVPALRPISSGKPIATTASQSNFVQRLGDVANKVEQASGIPASYMLGQAGHETGWGRSEIRNKDGSPSFNLFGIKAGSGWTGKVASVTTTEYVNGEPRKTVAKFRAYDSYEESFRDYARMITQNPRYAKASEQTGSPQAYASALQRAGYATDPAYATKLTRAIHTTLQLQRTQA